MKPRKRWSQKVTTTFQKYLCITKKLVHVGGFKVKKKIQDRYEIDVIDMK